MLVVSRKVNEKILIFVDGVRIEVSVGSIRGQLVRIGIDAPQNVKVLREELENEIGDLEGFKR
jgi:carbon storage regulator CsrA